MTATNHAITGSLIAIAVDGPLLALPLAFLSHFVLDMMPHFGNHPEVKWGTRQFHRIVITDGVIVLFLLVFLVVLFPGRWLIALAGALLAILPDVVWLPHYVRAKRKLAPVEHGFFARWHKSIQVWERPWGMISESAWFILMAILFARFV